MKMKTTIFLLVLSLGSGAFTSTFAVPVRKAKKKSIRTIPPQTEISANDAKSQKAGNESSIPFYKHGKPRNGGEQKGGSQSPKGGGSVGGEGSTNA